MANNIQVQKTVGAGGVLKGKAVKASGANVVAFSAATDAIVGIALMDALEGEIVAVVVAGEVDVEAGGALSQLDLITTNAAGEFIEQAASGAQTVDTYGKSLEGSVDGRYTRVIIYDSAIPFVGA